MREKTKTRKKFSKDYMEREEERRGYRGKSLGTYERRGELEEERKRIILKRRGKKEITS